MNAVDTNVFVYALDDSDPSKQKMAVRRSNRPYRC